MRRANQQDPENPGSDVALNAPAADNNANLPLYTTVVYALQAAGFLNGLTFIAAVIMNYIKRDEVAGSWLESHFRWQIRTFWFGLLWAVVGTLTLVILIGYTILMINTLWVIYRIVHGWLRLAYRQPMPV